MPILATANETKRSGNYRPGPGRPAGRKNNSTLALEAAALRAAASVSEGFEGDAHAFLQAVYRNPEVPLEIRIMAAGRALRVEKPALAASHSVSEIHVNLAGRLEAARLRVARQGRLSCTVGNGLQREVPALESSVD